jgi:hypothetical protein
MLAYACKWMESAALKQKALANVYICGRFFICFYADIIIQGEGKLNVLIIIKGEEK